jgi:putative transposase
MRKSRFSEQQIVGMLKQHEGGMKMADVCREHGISVSTFQNWKAKYGGMEVSELQRVKRLEEENSRLKRMYAEVCMMNDAMKAVIEKKWGA